MMHSQASEHRSCGTCTVDSSFCSFSPELRSVFDQLKTTVYTERGQALFREFHPCHSVYMVCAGSMKLVTTSREGRSLLLRILHPGDTLGIPEAVAGTVWESSAVAAEPTILAEIPASTFLRFVASYREASSHMLVTLAELYKAAQQELRFIGSGESSSARLARLLLDWSSTTADAEPRWLRHVTQTDLAQAIGATRETVTRSLGELIHLGIVARVADSLEILDERRLSEMASTDRITNGRDADRVETTH